MSLSQAIEMKLTGRKPSNSPAEALCVLLGFETRTEQQEHRLADELHWAYGTTWGLGRVPLARIPEPEQSLLYFLGLWGSGAALLTTTRLSPPPTQWSTRSLVTDLVHHAVYAAAGGIAAHWLRRRAVRSR